MAARSMCRWWTKSVGPGVEGGTKQLGPGINGIVDDADELGVDTWHSVSFHHASLKLFEPTHSKN